MKVLISGASRGIGLFLAQKMIADGYQVFGTFNKTNPSDEFQGKLSQVEITNHIQVSEWVNSIVNPADEIVLINCVGINYNAFAHKASADQWKKVIEVNLVGTFNLINAVLPFMREKSFGRIINFSSIVAQKGTPGASAYAASKAGLWGMTRSIAAENAQKGITVNNLNLGYFDIGMISEIPDAILTAIKKTIPMQKLGTPDTIFNAVKFLISSNYITGTSIDINGGLF